MPRPLGILVLLLSLTSRLAAQTDIALASNGLDFLAVYATGNRPSLESAAYATLRADTKALGAPQTLAIFSTPQFAVSRQSAAFAANVYLVATEERLNIALRRVTANGVLIDTAPKVIGVSATGPPAVATDGASFLVVWPEYERLWAAVVSPDGTVGSVQTLVQRTGSFFRGPRIAFDGTRYAVTYGAQNGIEVISVTREGVAGQPLPLFSTFQPDAPIASSGSDYLVVANVDGDVVAWSLTPQFSVARKTTLLHGLDAAASVAWNGASYTVAWRALTPFNFGKEFPQSFLGVTHVRTDGTFDPISSIATGDHDAIHPFSPAVAAEMIVIDPLLAFRAGEISQRVDPPAVPLITSARITPQGLTVTWTPQSANARGFIVQSTAVPASATSLTIAGAQAPMTVTVSAWNEAGLSTASAYVRAPYRAPGRR